MVAKALARAPQATGSNRAELDRLAAEFADELSNLGVRVSELEKYADKVVLHGFLRYTYSSARVEQADGHKNKTNTDRIKFRFEPVATVNDHWTLRARIDADSDMKTNEGVTGDFSLVRGWAQGKYNAFAVNVGKMPMQLDDKLLFDSQLSGASVAFGKDLKLTLQAGRWDRGQLNSSLRLAGSTDPINMQSAGLDYKKSKFNIGASYHHLNTDNFKKASYTKSADDDDANVWVAGLGYRFDKNFALGGQYAQNTTADDYKKAYTIQLDYKSAKRTQANTWGLYAAYRYLGNNVAFHPTYGANGGVEAGHKGWEIGAAYAPWKNILFQAKYVNGKVLTTDRDSEKLFGRVEFFF